LTPRASLLPGLLTRISENNIQTNEDVGI
jgi:hypothetical protein